MADKKSKLESVFEAIAIKPGYPKGERWFGEKLFGESKRSAPRRRNDPALSRAPKTFAVQSTKSAESSGQAMRNPTQRAYSKDSPSYSGAGVPMVPKKDRGVSAAAAAPIPKPKPDRKPKPATDKSRVAGKSKTRVAFEQEFAKQRKAGKKEFTFKGKKYTTKLK
jgi:hypothetical protein